MESKIIQGECLLELANNKDLEEYKGNISLIYIDPPFMTQKTQKLHENSYEDKFKTLEDYLDFLKRRIVLGKRFLKDNGSFFIHVDYRTVHYVKVMMDAIFGRDCFMNEIIWAYDYGGRSKSYWSRKHDTILWYVNNKKDYTFNYDNMDRIPYMAPGLVGEEKVKRGKTPTDCWWHTIVPTNGKERQGYPTQKPLGVLNRIIKVHTSPGDIVMDFFAGTGTTAVSAANLNRKYVAIDQNPDAIEIIKKRINEIS